MAAVLGSADLAVGNLECPVSNRGARVSKPWTFRAAPAAMAVVARHFDAVSLANNHTGDFGTDALVDTLRRLREARVPSFGAGGDLAAAHTPLVIERNGLKIGLIGCNEFKPRAFEAGASQPGVAWCEDEQLLADLRAARAAGADVVIPFLHWGWENEPDPCPRQVALARRLIDAGADAVVGSHPHVTQGTATWKGRPIVYSLGNFLFDGFRPGPNREGWILRMVLDRQGVVRWDVTVVRMDERGVPTVASRVEGPSGARGE